MINSIDVRDRSTIERYLATMQAGPGGLDELVGLFEDDAVYVEPFTGQPQVHAGKAEIRAFFENALQQHLRDVRLTLDRLDVDGGRLGLAPRDQRLARGAVHGRPEDVALELLVAESDPAEGLGVRVAGCSVDTLEKQQAFAKNLGNIRFPLIADPDGEIARAFEVYMDGRSMAARAARPTSFLSCHRTSTWGPPR